jgi:hypothetical protein
MFVIKRTIFAGEPEQFLKTNIPEDAHPPPGNQVPNKLAIRRSPLRNLYADAGVTVNRIEDLVFHPERSDEFFESPEFVNRARKLIKENEVS